MKHFIDPTVDCVFKAILGSSEHIDLLIHFLNGILNLAIPIESLTIENPYSIVDDIDAKMHIVDIKARDENGSLYQIELQLTSPKHLPSRMVNNLCQIHGNQLKKGEVYDKVMPTISIWLVTNDIRFDNDYDYKIDDVKFHFTLCDMDKGACLSKNISIFLVNMHRWRKPQYLTDEDYWLYFLNEASHWKALPGDAQIPQLQEAMSVLEDFSDKKESFLVYQTRLAAYTAQLSVEAEREQVFAENRRLKEESKQIEQQLKQSAKQVKQAEQQVKQAEQQAKQAEQQAKQAEQQAKQAEQQAKQAEQQAKQAEQQAKHQLVIGLLTTTDMAVEQIAQLSNLSVEQVEQIAKS